MKIVMRITDIIFILIASYLVYKGTEILGDYNPNMLYGTYATAYFVLAGVLLFVVLGNEILYAIKEQTRAIQTPENIRITEHEQEEKYRQEWQNYMQRKDEPIPKYMEDEMQGMAGTKNRKL